MPVSVFTYGSLMFAPVWQHVVRGTYSAQPALLPGYRRFSVAGQLYPSVIAEAGASVDGVLYLDVDPVDLAALDRFEGTDYCRIPVGLLDAAGRSLAGDTYVFRDRSALSDLPWRPEDFDLTAFIATWCATG